MKFWLDAQLPPSLAEYLNNQFEFEFTALREIGLRDATDLEIFNRACAEDAVIISKDSDFIELIHRMGHPPKLLWVTCGNVSNEHLKKIFDILLVDAVKILENGEAVVEIGDAPM